MVISLRHTPRQTRQSYLQGLQGLRAPTIACKRGITFYVGGISLDPLRPIYSSSATCRQKMQLVILQLVVWVSNYHYTSIISIPKSWPYYQL